MPFKCNLHHYSVDFWGGAAASVRGELQAGAFSPPCVVGLYKLNALDP